MALHVLAYNLTRVMNIIGVRPLMDAIKGVRQNPRPDTWRSARANIAAGIFTRPRLEVIRHPGRQVITRKNCTKRLLVTAEYDQYQSSYSSQESLSSTQLVSYQ